MRTFLKTSFGTPQTPTNPWTSRVHSEMAREGLSLTFAEIEQRFGSPSDMLTRRVIENAVQRGWFAVSGEHGRRRYTAIQRQFEASEHEGFGYGIGKIRSVFELGAACTH